MSDQYSMLEHAYHAAKDALQVTKDGSLVGGELPPSLAAGQTNIAFEVWCAKTGQARGWLSDGANGHAL